MSEELLQRGLSKSNPTAKVGKWDYFNIGATSIKALKAAKIIRNLDYGVVENKKLDALLVNRQNVVAVVEFKPPKEFKTEKQRQKAINQEIEVAQALGAKIIIASDTKDTVWVNALTGNKILNESGTVFAYPFDIADEQLASVIQKINESINEKNNQILPPQLVNPTDLARSIWQDIWSVTGATPENCLYTFVELFIFKYLSDLGILKTTNSFGFLMSMYENQSTDNEVLDYYAGNIRKKIKELFPYNPLDNTTIINGTIFVSKDHKAVEGYSTVFKKVLKKFNDYGNIEHIDYDFKSKLFESFLKESISKKNWGQFFTPMKVVRAIEKISKDEIKEGAIICDPACGVGKFLLEPIKSRLDRFFEIKNGKLISKITLHGFDKGFDKDEQKTIILAKANMLIYFSEIIKNHTRHTEEFSDLFNKSFELKTNSILGTLSEVVEDKYDLILTNPPYVTSGSSNLKEEIQKDLDLKNHFKINAIGVEGLFMEWIVRALKPNGKAFIIVPDGIFNRQNDKNLRAFLKQECFIDGIISLPLNTFFTTNKKTYILCLTKKGNRTDIQTDPVFTYLCSEIGESRDVYRFDIEQNDLDEATTRYCLFKGNKTAYAKTMGNDDPRCKIVPIDQFEPDSHWSVDRWWGIEEKIALGIEDKKSSIDALEFSAFISDIAETLGGFSAMLKDLSEKKNLINDITIKEISLNDGNLFNLFIGKRITKAELQNIRGDIPIFSANVFKPIGFHTKSNILEFNNCSVLWGIDGDFAFRAMKKHTPFVTTDHCGTIEILSEQILPEYLALILEQAKHSYGFDRGLRSSLKNMKSITVKIPVIQNGEFDIEYQQSVVEKHNIITELKQKLEEYRTQIEPLTIVDNGLHRGNVVQENLGGTWLEYISTKTGWTKTDLVKIDTGNINDIPVFSAAKQAVAYVNCEHKAIIIASKEKPLISFASNGDGSAGANLIFHTSPFFVSNDRTVIRILNPKINSEYVFHQIQDMKKRYGFNHAIKATKNNLDRVIVNFPITETDDFDFDFDIQSQIAQRYEQIENIKRLLLMELNKLQEIDIVL